MSRILKSPACYVQGPGVLGELDRYLQGMGKCLLLLISAGGLRRSGPTLERCFADKGYTLHIEIFSGECTRETVEAYAGKAGELGCTAVIGIGGGKILDTAKGVAHVTGLPMAIIPTVASTDAPCSSLSVLYHDNGEFDRYLFLEHCPNAVVVDSEIIAKAPPELLAAGMGDAMATWFEARACRASGKNNQVGGTPTYAAQALTECSWRSLKENGQKALEAAKLGVCTEALECVVEVNTYVSGVGFESGGLAAAHAIQKGFTFIPALNELYHGVKVAFCTLSQLVMENAPRSEIEEVMEFCLSVGLPICFDDMGYHEVERERLGLAAEKACVPGSTIHNMPFAVTPAMVLGAMLTADALGKRYHRDGHL